MIPARIGSTRLRMKNLALINGAPLISYAIKAAQNAGVFDRIVLNSDHPVFEKIATRYAVDFYQRPTRLGGSDIKSDDVVADFMEKNPGEIVAWVNPTSPLQTGDEIKKVIDYFIDAKLDSLITVNDEQVHCNYAGAPVNYELEGRFAQTQDLVPVQAFVYSIMMWRTTAFMDAYRRKGYALFCGQTGFYKVSKLSGVIIKRSEDLILADQILRSRQANTQIAYDAVVADIENENG